ncbi:hypothetical protein JKP88DRAFT_246723 [Tribonema minus]|uniref:Uncharacterized protein n=1 Tax=Tribonema minus TaxID=303371 RepID=A0A835YTW2_9STRA|nr:hypothetical protein JKP88DRAFT_246723 [Tribonema minus]
MAQAKPAPQEVHDAAPAVREAVAATAAADKRKPVAVDDEGGDGGVAGEDGDAGSEGEPDSEAESSEADGDDAGHAEAGGVDYFSATTHIFDLNKDEILAAVPENLLFTEFFKPFAVLFRAGTVKGKRVSRLATSLKFDNFSSLPGTPEDGGDNFFDDLKQSELCKHWDISKGTNLKKAAFVPALQEDGTRQWIDGDAFLKLAPVCLSAIGKDMVRFSVSPDVAIGEPTLDDLICIRHKNAWWIGAPDVTRVAMVTFKVDDGEQYKLTLRLGDQTHVDLTLNQKDYYNGGGCVSHTSWFFVNDVIEVARPTLSGPGASDEPVDASPAGAKRAAAAPSSKPAAAAKEKARRISKRKAAADSGGRAKTKAPRTRGGDEDGGGRDGIKAPRTGGGGGGGTSATLVEIRELMGDHRAGIRNDTFDAVLDLHKKLDRVLEGNKRVLEGHKRILAILTAE